LHDIDSKCSMVNKHGDYRIIQSRVKIVVEKKLKNTEEDGLSGTNTK